MKNKTLKNLIAISAFAIFVVSFSNASAYDSGYRVSVMDINPPAYNSNMNYPSAGTYDYAQPSQNNYAQQQPYTYVQPQVRYVEQPAPTVIQYVPQQQTVQTVRANTQGASVVNANTATTTRSVARVSNGPVAANGSGQYVNYDPNTQGVMLANAYGAYNGQQVAVQNGYDNNGVTALTVKGSGGFMPTSVFQWFMLILIILAIVIIARMISKTFSNGAHGAPAH